MTNLSEQTSLEANCDRIMKRHVPVVGSEHAIMFLTRMYDADLMYHPDDDPWDIFRDRLTPMQIEWITIVMETCELALRDCPTGDIYGQSITLINHIYQP